MRILFDSRKSEFKTPFGTLTPNQACTLHIHVPSTVEATMVMCVVCRQDGQELHRYPLSFRKKQGIYDVFGGEISLAECGLYFYYFHVVQSGKGFRLYKQGNHTNMESGDLWQVSCVPEDFSTPDWAKGAAIYQVFPDRFCKSGECDLTGKLQPYTVHENWDEEVDWQPDAQGRVLNNDFFGGNFRGITKKMEYIASLGVEILYLNPISKSFSSHRYDTGDYKTPDPMLGTEADFSALCEESHKHNIRVVLDGVYSHTGSDSLYFDKNKTFGGKGAYCDPCSPYRSWYTFHQYPDLYESWWNFDTLPTVKKMDPAFIRYVISDEDSVVAHWLKLGADGFRLDVVDELPNEFVLLLKKRIRQIKPDALLIGEVWEDASNKVAYNVRRRYFVDGVLDSCMNYPFRTAILNFLRGADDGQNLQETVMSILENYPAQVVACNMNLLGTHDTPRILTALVDDFDGSREVLAARTLTPEDRALAEERLLLASFLQYMLPGAPSLYYADETGMEGHKDPFNRRTYPWGHENETLLAHFRGLGQLRKNSPVLRLGTTEFFRANDGQIGFRREYEGKAVRIYVNRSDVNWEIPAGRILFARNLKSLAPNWLSIAPMGFCVIEE